MAPLVLTISALAQFVLQKTPHHIDILLVIIAHQNHEQHAVKLLQVSVAVVGHQSLKESYHLNGAHEQHHMMMRESSNSPVGEPLEGDLWQSTNSRLQLVLLWLQGLLLLVLPQHHHHLSHDASTQVVTSRTAV